MFDYLLSKEQLKIRDEARELVKWVPRQMILDMDAERIRGQVFAWLILTVSQLLPLFAADACS
jgi:hypothetical protein